MSAPFTGQAESVVKFTLTAAQWTAQNRVLQDNEIGIESDTGFAKIGDGSTAWSSLGYFNKDSAATLGATVNAASAATPNNTDLVATVESSVVKKITWTNVKAFLKTYFDTLYQGICGATVAEIDRFNDVSAYQETILAAGAISVTKVFTKLELAGAGAVTLAVPDAGMLGQVKVIEQTADNGDVTLDLTNVVGQSSGTTATFGDVGDKLVLIAAVDKWVVLKEQGIALS